jgi:GntR family transcriptional repressor for pyruvate dehydrogenase complex
MSDTSSARKRYQVVAREVAAAIRRGDYARERKLPSERELAEQFGVSRPTVREAMIALEIQGFVESRHGSGIHILNSHPVEGAAHGGEGAADLDVGPFELTEARRVIEGEACALAATSITDAEIDELRRLLADMAVESAAPHREGESLAPSEGADRRFHILIAEATRNSALASVVETLWDMRYRSPLCREMLTRARNAGDRPRAVEHASILDALAARDPRAARHAMRDHLTKVIEGLLTATEGEAVRQAREAAEARRAVYMRRGSI